MLLCFSRFRRSFFVIAVCLNALLLTFSFSSSAIAAPADAVLDASFTPTPGKSPLYLSVQAVQPDGKILIFGGFQIQNTPRSGFSRLNADGSLDATFNPVVVGGISYLSLAPDGKIYIAGSFTSVSGVTRRAFTRLLPDGSLDTSFNPQIDNNAVTFFTVQPDGKILVAGSFTSVSGTARNKFARLNADGTLNTGFNVELTFYENAFRGDIEVQADGRIIVGGNINAANGITNQGLVRLMPNGNVDLNYTATTGTTGANLYPRSLILQADGKLLIGGNFGAVNSITRNSLARLNADGTLDDAFVPFTNALGAFADIQSIALQPDGKILALGKFSRDLGNGTRVNDKFARFNADGSRDMSFTTPAFDSYRKYATVVTSFVLQPDGKFIAAGFFTIAGGAFRNSFARFNADGSSDGSFTNRAITSTNPADGLTVGEIEAVTAQPDGKILIGGLFSNVNNLTYANIARLNADGTTDTSFNTAADGAEGDDIRGVERTGRVTQIAVQPDGKIVIGGFFNAVNGTTRFGVSRLNADGSLDASFTANIASNYIISLAALTIQPDGKLLVGGQFLESSGQNSRYFVRLNADGSTDNSFAAIVNNFVQTIVVQADGKIVIGGSFTAVNGAARGKVARLNADGTLDTTFNAIIGGANTSINSIIQQPDGKFIIAGGFTGLNGGTRKYLARLNADGSTDESFNPAAANTFYVLRLARQPDGKILVTGYADAALGVATVYRINADGSRDQTFTPLTETLVGNEFPYRTLLVQRNGVIIGGKFVYVNGQLRTSLARYSTPTVARRVRSDFDADGKADLSVFRPANGTWYAQRSTAGFFAVQFGANGDIPVAADFDGDNKSDIAVFRPSNGGWYILRSADNSFYAAQFGQSGDVPVAEDFDGDLKEDLAVWRPSNGAWYAIRSSNNSFFGVGFGQSGDRPTLGDFDGDARADIAVFRPSDGYWYRINSQTNSFVAVQFGVSEDRPVAADYDGDGKTDIAVFRPSAASWYRLNSSTGAFVAQQFGASTDVPVPTDYDGDGRDDLAVFRPSNSGWYYANSAGSQIFIAPFGTTGDVPTPSVFVP